MDEVYHIKVKKEYAASLIQELLKNEAVEHVSDQPDLQQWQKDELDKEIQAFAEDPDDGLLWDKVKSRFKQTE